MDAPQLQVVHGTHSSEYSVAGLHSLYTSICCLKIARKAINRVIRLSQVAACSPVLEARDAGGGMQSGYHWFLSGREAAIRILALFQGSGLLDLETFGEANAS